VLGREGLRMWRLLLKREKGGNRSEKGGLYILLNCLSECLSIRQTLVCYRFLGSIRGGGSRNRKGLGGPNLSISNVQGNFRGGGGRNKRRLGGTSLGISFHVEQYSY
jgi:hypothetical protein